MANWKAAVGYACDLVERTGFALVTPEAENAMYECLGSGRMFYDCGTPGRRFSSASPTRKAVRRWLWGIRHEGVWKRRDPAFMIVRGKDGTWNCTVGVLVPVALSPILDPATTVEFTEAT